MVPVPPEAVGPAEPAPKVGSGFEVLFHWGPTRETVGPSKEGWAMLDTYRTQAPGLKTFVVATYAFPSVDHHSHFTHMRGLRKEKYCIQAGLARSADPESHPVPQGRVDLALTVVLAPAGALPRGHSPKHGFPPFVGPRSGQLQGLSHPGLREWKPCLGNRLLPSPPPPTTSAVLQRLLDFGKSHPFHPPS